MLQRGVLILYNQPRQAPGTREWKESDEGVMQEVEAVAAALSRLGIRHRSAGIRRLQDTYAALSTGDERVVFNLVEGLEGDPTDFTLVPAVCTAMGQAYTGSGAACQLLCVDKWQTKAQLQSHGIRTPAAIRVAPGHPVPRRGLPRGRLIVKPLRADASEGISPSSVVLATDRPALESAVARVHREFGQAALLEQFIDGRELNVSVLTRGDSLQVLPLAEIDFSALPATYPRIVDYAAKWDPSSEVYLKTPRKIPAELDHKTADAVRDLARRTWQAVGCSGYARVDIRLDGKQRPFVLEVNPNPDISPDAGFPAACQAAGLAYDEFVQEAVTAAARTLDTDATPTVLADRDPGDGPYTIRWSVPEDRAPILKAIVDTGLFRSNEVAIATEVLDDALAHGKNGHYQSYTLLSGTRPVGWVCFGPTPCTLGTYDVYWIVVAPDVQGKGLGRRLMADAEKRILERGGRLVVVETSGRSIYQATIGFYLRNRYVEAARVKDFYAEGDDRVVLTKKLA
jgi:D-alanine-D-alanine ligase